MSCWSIWNNVHLPLKKNEKKLKIWEIISNILPCYITTNVYYGGIFYFTYQTNFEHLLTLIMWCNWYRVCFIVDRVETIVLWWTPWYSWLVYWLVLMVCIGFRWKLKFSGNVFLLIFSSFGWKFWTNQF